MANRMTSPVGIPDYQPKAAPRGPLAEVPRDFNGSAESVAMGAIAEKLSARFGELADQAARSEGAAAGAIAGMDPNFRPSGAPTIRGRARDAAALDVYASNLTTRLSSDLADLYDANRDNPAGFQQAAETLRKRYVNSDVFPEVLPQFNQRFANLELSYRLRTRDNFETATKDRQRATFVGDLAASETNRARLIAAGADPEAMQREIDASIADDAARIDALVRDGSYTAEHGAKLKQSLESSAAVSVLSAAAGRLARPGEIDQFRETTRQRFAKGEIKGLDGDTYQKLDGALERMSAGLRTRNKAAIADLSKRLDDYASRVARGDTPTTAEWVSLNAEAATLDEGGVLIDKAQRRAAIADRLAALSPDQAIAEVDRMTAEARKAPKAGSFVAPASANINQVDPRLVDIVKSAAEGLGLNVRVTPSGGKNARRAGTQNHPTGRALDIEILDADGKPLPNFQNGKSFRAYEELAQAAKALQSQKYPDLEESFRWGGYFSGTWNADLMHFDVSGGGMAGGTWKDGLTPAMRRLYPDAESKGGAASRVVRLGMSREASEDLQFARQLAETKQRAYQSDMLGAAAGERLIDAPTPFDIGAADAPRQLQARISQADAVAGARSREPQYLRPSEKPALLSRLSEGGDVAMKTLADVVAGAGPKAPAILREIGQDAPVMAQAGYLLAAGGSANAVKDALDAVRLKKDGASLPAPKPEDKRTLTAEVIGEALAVNPQERNRVEQLAGFIYAARAGRLNVEPGTADANAIYRQALQDAAGGVTVGEEQFGGFVNWGGFWGGRRRGTVSVPPGLSATALPAMIDSIRPEDLSSLPVPPIDEAGKPVPPRDLQMALPVRHGNGFRFMVEDPQTGEDVYIRGADGRPFVLQADALKDIAALRRAVEPR